MRARRIAMALGAGAATLALAACGGSSFDSSQDLFDAVREVGDCEPDEEGNYEEYAEGEADDGWPAVNVKGVQCYGDDAEDSILAVLIVSADDATGDDLVELARAEGVDGYLISGVNWIMVTDDGRDPSTERWAEQMATELAGTIEDS